MIGLHAAGEPVSMSAKGEDKTVPAGSHNVIVAAIIALSSAGYGLASLAQRKKG
jgi:hypothetical protein